MPSFRKSNIDMAAHGRMLQDQIKEQTEIKKEQQTVHQISLFLKQLTERKRRRETRNAKNRITNRKRISK
jgi:hypothetical protein